MTITVNNLYEHADGGFYCILSDTTPGKDPTTGEWLDGVTYMGTDGVMRRTSRARWDERFNPVAEYSGDDEQVIMMVRRANPGNTDFDFLRVFESWHESEMGITGHMLELAVAVVVERFASLYPALPEGVQNPDDMRFAISTEDLQRIVQSYEIARQAVPHGFVFHIRK